MVVEISRKITWIQQGFKASKRKSGENQENSVNILESYSLNVTKIYSNKSWSSTESVSGRGSEFEATENIRVNLPKIIKYYKVNKIVETDKGCVLRFKDLNNPIILSCREAYGVKYVGFLITQIGYITYEYSEVYKGDTWRKI